MPQSIIKRLIAKVARRLLAYSTDRSASDIDTNLSTDPFEIGRLDAIAAGWFNEADRCLYQDFVIEDEDIVLDVGSGNGGVANFCGQFCGTIIITDIDVTNAASAFQAVKETTCNSKVAVISDTMPLPIADNTIDKVVSMEVIEHVDNPTEFLKELFRVGVSGARYLISAPAGISERLQQGIAADEHFLPPNHIQIFDNDELLTLIKEQGFVIEAVHLDGFYWTMWWLIFWCDGQPLAPPWSGLLQSWPKLWADLMLTDNAASLREKLNQAIPKTQIIIATKP